MLWGDAEDEDKKIIGFTKKIIGVERSVAGCPGSQSFSLQPRQLVGRVTMAAQIKFIQPPLFAEKEEEDVTEWMERDTRRLETIIGRDAEKSAHVELSLPSFSAVRKWFK